jgi:hypothetical protein
MFAKQALYPLSPTSSTFCSSYFRDGILILLIHWCLTELYVLFGLRTQK